MCSSGEVKMRGGSRTWGSPLISRKISGDRREAQKKKKKKKKKRNSEEDAASSLGQAGQFETYTDGLCHSPTSSSLRWVSTLRGTLRVLG